MKYLKHYTALIFKAKRRIIEPDIYYEKHHWYPKSLFPKCAKEPWNIVKLTAREHFIAHWLLCKIYPGNKSMAFAFNSMTRSSNNQKRYYNSRGFESARKAVGLAFKGQDHMTEQQKANQRVATSVANRDPLRSAKRRLTNSIRLRDPVRNAHQRAITSQICKGHKHMTEEQKGNLMAAVTDATIRSFINERDGRSFTGTTVELKAFLVTSGEWLPSGISFVINGKKRHHKGWTLIK